MDEQILLELQKQTAILEALQLKAENIELGLTSIHWACAFMIGAMACAYLFNYFKDVFK